MLNSNQLLLKISKALETDQRSWRFWSISYSFLASSLFIYTSQILYVCYGPGSMTSTETTKTERQSPCLSSFTEAHYPRSHTRGNIIGNGDCLGSVTHYFHQSLCLLSTSYFSTLFIDNDEQNIQVFLHSRTLCRN